MLRHRHPQRFLSVLINIESLSLLLHELLELSLLLHRHQTEDKEWELPLHRNVRELPSSSTTTTTSISSSLRNKRLGGFRGGRLVARALR